LPVVFGGEGFEGVKGGLRVVAPEGEEDENHGVLFVHGEGDVGLVKPVQEGSECVAAGVCQREEGGRVADVVGVEEGSVFWEACHSGLEPFGKRYTEGEWRVMVSPG